MIEPSTDTEHIARAFPSPKHSRPARSLTYEWSGHVYRAVIGQLRRKCDDSRRGGGRGKWKRAGKASGSVVLSIVATRQAVEIWCCEPARGWPNPSMVPHDAVLSIDYLDSPGTIDFCRDETLLATLK
jgi:hypothetical protein